MEFDRTQDDAVFSDLHGETTLALRTITDPALLLSPKRMELDMELEAILQELDEWIESEGGILIP